MRVVIDRIEEDVAIMEKEDGSFAEMSKRLIPSDAKEGDVLQITVDRQSTVNRKEDITTLMEELWESDEEER